jgi:hypothetical protein
MWWLWIVGPFATGLVFFLTGGRDGRREAELDRWLNASRVARRVSSLPGLLARILVTTGGGEVVGYFSLVPKLAYLAVMGGDPTQGSDHATVLARLDEPAPTFTVRPLPIVEGQRIPNTGVQFKKDEEFMELFLVERELEGVPSSPVDEGTDKAIRKWLSPPLREALLDFPDGWLRVDGEAKTMAFTLYGPFAADRADQLIAAADIVFAEYGAGGGPSLIDDEEEDGEDAPTGTDGSTAAPPAPPAKKKQASPKPAAKR